jgi:hypothetical protein
LVLEVDGFVVEHRGLIECFIGHSSLISIYKDTNCANLCTIHCKILGEDSVWTSRKDLYVLIFENSVLILKLFNVEVACICNENVGKLYYCAALDAASKNFVTSILRNGICAAQLLLFFFFCA